MMNRLYRSRTDKKLFGICGGIAAFLGVDSTLVRIGFVALTLLSGAALFLYVLLLVIVPREPNWSDGVLWLGGGESWCGDELDREIEQMEKRALKEEVYRLRAELARLRME